MKKILLTMLFAMVSCIGVLGSGVAEAADNSSLGFVNLSAVFSAYPGIGEAQKTLQDEQTKLQEEFTTKSASMSDADKTKLQQELNQELIKKQMEVMQPIQKKVSAAIEKAAKAKGIHQVIKAEEILYGGLDITQDVTDIIKK